MKKYTIKDFINKDLVFVGNYIEAKNIAKALKEEGIDTRVIDRIVCANSTEFILFSRANSLVMSFDANLIMMTECDSNAEVIHYHDLELNIAMSDNVHVSEFVKGNVAIKFNRDNAIETLETLFKNGFHFYSTTDDEILEDMANHIDYVTDEEKTCIMDVFFLPVAKNIINNSCIVYDKHSKSLKYNLDKEVKKEGKCLVDINSVNFNMCNPKFAIDEVVNVEDENGLHTGIIVNYDDINNEYEVSCLTVTGHVLLRIKEEYIHKIRYCWDCKGCRHV